MIAAVAALTRFQPFSVSVFCASGKNQISKERTFPESTTLFLSVCPLNESF